MCASYVSQHWNQERNVTFINMIVLKILHNDLSFCCCKIVSKINDLRQIIVLYE